MCLGAARTPTSRGDAWQTPTWSLEVAVLAHFLFTLHSEMCLGAIRTPTSRGDAWQIFAWALELTVLAPSWCVFASILVA